MTKDGLDAMATLWQCFVVLTALVIMTVLSLTMASLEASPVLDADPVGTSKWIALWLICVLGYVAYMLRKYLWQPALRLFACPLGARDVWTLILFTAVAASPYGVVLGLWVGIALELENAPWVFLFFVPIVLLWDWGMAKGEAHARWVLGLCGFVDPRGA